VVNTKSPLLGDVRPNNRARERSRRASPPSFLLPPEFDRTLAPLCAGGGRRQLGAKASA
jgi:hypothetical protein